jgi:hypothetical protein
VFSTASNVASGNGSVSAPRIRKRTCTPALPDFFLARAISAG